MDPIVKNLALPRGKALGWGSDGFFDYLDQGPRVTNTRFQEETTSSQHQIQCFEKFSSWFLIYRKSLYKTKSS